MLIKIRTEDLPLNILVVSLKYKYSKNLVSYNKARLEVKKLTLYSKLGL